MLHVLSVRALIGCMFCVNTWFNLFVFMFHIIHCQLTLPSSSCYLIIGIFALPALPYPACLFSFFILPVCSLLCWIVVQCSNRLLLVCLACSMPCPAQLPVCFCFYFNINNSPFKSSPHPYHKTQHSLYSLLKSLSFRIVLKIFEIPCCYEVLLLNSIN